MFPFGKTFGSLQKAKLYGIILMCGILAVCSIVLLVVLVTGATAHFTQFDSTWLNRIIDGLTGVAAMVVGWFVLPVFMVLFAGLFQQKTINRVEAAYYPDIIREGSPGFWPDMVHDIRFTAKALFLNVLILPLYFIGIGFVISIVLNSYLLGREFFESAAGHHMGKPAARTLGQQNKVSVYCGGFVIVLMSLTPVLNIIMPILATVWMVHVYHGINKDL